MRPTDRFIRLTLIHSPDFNKALEAFYLKMLSYLVRFALILHTVKQVTGETQVQEIELETLQQAKSLTDYFLNHAQHALNLMIESGQSKRAKITANWIKQKGLPMVAARDLLAGRIANCETASEAKALLKQLHEFGLGYWNSKTKRFIPYVD